MENRETKTIKTPIGGNEVVIYTYVTGGEKRRLAEPYLREDLEMSQKHFQGQDAALNTIIVSIDGNKEDIVKKILDMHSADYDFITTAVSNIAAGVDATEKKK